MKICGTCGKREGCQIKLNDEDFCLNWQYKPFTTSDLWEAIARVDTDALKQWLNDKYQITLKV